MEITREDLENRQVLLTIKVDEERVEKALRGAARKVSRQYNIPGFRRGRAPFSIILQRFGREALLQEVADDLGQEVYEQALDSQELEPYGPAGLEDLQLDPLVYKMRVSLKPIVELGDYRELRVAPPDITVDEEQVAKELEKLQQENVVMEPAGDQPAQMGDMVDLDVHAEVDGEALDSQEHYTTVLDAEDEEFAPGFAEQIVGMHSGEEKQFVLSLSDEWGEELVGHEADFTVNLHDIRARILPDLDDDLARTVGDFDSLEELREGIHNRIQDNLQHKADQEYLDKVVGTLVEQATIEYPPELVEEHIDDMLKDLEARLESQGIELDNFLKLNGQTKEAFRETMRPRAEEQARSSLVLSELARLEALKVEPLDIQQRIAEVSESWGERSRDVLEMLSSPDGVRSIAGNLLTEKVIERLTAIARGEAPVLRQAQDRLLGQATDVEEAEDQAEAESDEGAPETAEAEEAEDQAEAELDESEPETVEAAEAEAEADTELVQEENIESEQTELEQEAGAEA